MPWVIMLVSYRAISGCCSPQAGQVYPGDGPKINKATFVDIGYSFVCAVQMKTWQAAEGFVLVFLKVLLR